VRALIVLSVLVTSVNAFADDMETRELLTSALNAGNAARLAAIVGNATVDVKDVWFDTVACRKKWKSASLTAQNASELSACMAGLGVAGRGTDIDYGPGITLHARFEAVDGAYVLRELRGDPIVDDPAQPTVGEFYMRFATKGGYSLELDSAAEDEVRAAGDGPLMVTVCVDKKGKPRVAALSPRVSPTGHAAKLMNKRIAAWKIAPFELRKKPIAVCAILPTT
jgi:hypothetical protein